MTAPTRLHRYLFRIAFTFVGIGATVIASTLEALCAYLRIDLQNGGIFTAAFFIGSTMGIFSGGLLLDRITSRPVSMTGAGLAGVGLLALALTPAGGMVLALLSIIGFGFGYGFLVVCGNGLAPRYNPMNPARELSAINFFFGLGAILGPQVANIAFTMGDFKTMYVLVAILAWVIAGVFAFMPNLPPIVKSAVGAKIGWAGLIPFGLMLFVYVGIEMGFATWISPQMTLVASSSVAMGALGISLFWAGMTAGRFFASIIAGRVSNELLLVLGIGMVGMGVLGVLIFPATEGILLILSVVVGFGCAPIFPLAIAILNARYPQGFGAVSGVIIAVGNSGAVVLPTVQGWVGGGANGGMLVPLIGAGVMLACALVAMRLPRQEEG
jgi:FHS family glucose/mannose:H+ symporter-like MFS transporter